MSNRKYSSIKLQRTLNDSLKASVRAADLRVPSGEWDRASRPARIARVWNRVNGISIRFTDGRIAHINASVVV